MNRTHSGVMFTAVGFLWLIVALGAIATDAAMNVAAACLVVALCVLTINRR